MYASVMQTEVIGYITNMPLAAFYYSSAKKIFTQRSCALFRHGQSKKTKRKASSFYLKANELLLGEFVIRALRARRHRVSAAEVHFGMTVGAVIRSASRSSSGLVDLIHAFLLDKSVCKRGIYYTKKCGMAQRQRTCAIFFCRQRLR